MNIKRVSTTLLVFNDVKKTSLRVKRKQEDKRIKTKLIE